MPMLSTAKIKYINSLKIKKYREAHQQFIAEGSKLVQEILLGAFVIDSIYATAQWMADNYTIIHDKEISFIEVTENELQRVSALTKANEVLAIVNIPEPAINIESVCSRLTLMLDDIKDPGNLGTIIRIADWFGIKDIICSDECVDTYNPKVVQATMGAIVRVNLFYARLADFLVRIPPDTMTYGTFMQGESIYDKQLYDKGIIIIGNESRGISDDLFPFIKERISIPSFDEGNKTQSLNASVAAGIICAEFRRQHQY